MSFWRSLIEFPFLGPAPPPLPPPPLEHLSPAAAPVDVIHRGRQAHRLLHDETLAGAFTELRAEAQAAWLNTAPADVEKREELYRIAQALELVRGKLITYRGAGRVREVEKEEKAA